MPSSAELRQQVNELYREICSKNILVESCRNHPNITSQMAAKNPVASLQILTAIFLLWSKLRDIQVPAPSFIHLAQTVVYHVS